MRLSNTLPSCCWCVWLWSGEELLCWPRGDECDHCTVTVVSKWRGSANLMMRPERLPLMIGWKFIKRENSGSIVGLLGKILVTLLWPLETPFNLYGTSGKKGWWIIIHIKHKCFVLYSLIQSLYRKYIFCRRWSSVHEKNPMSFFFHYVIFP